MWHGQYSIDRSQMHSLWLLGLNHSAKQVGQWAGVSSYRVIGHHHPPWEGAPEGWRYSMPISCRVMMPLLELRLWWLWLRLPAHQGNAHGTWSRWYSHKYNEHPAPVPTLVTVLQLRRCDRVFCHWASCTCRMKCSSAGVSFSRMRTMRWANWAFPLLAWRGPPAPGAAMLVLRAYFF